MIPPEIPEEHYAALGRVTVAAAKLEVLVGQTAAAASGTLQSRFAELASRPRQAMDALKRVAKQRQDRPELLQLHADAKRLLDERNKYVHALVVYDNAPEDGEPGPKWVLHRPWDGSDLPMPEPDELLELARQIDAVGARSVMVAYAFHEENHPAADSVRTEEA